METIDLLEAESVADLIFPSDRIIDRLKILDERFR